jgi:methionyl-tRNA formyltransferase
VNRDFSSSLVPTVSSPRIIFMGTPEFAVPSLKALLDGGCTVAAVVTAPDKPRGRGQQFSPTPVKQLALARALPVLQPENLRDRTFAEDLRLFQPELIVVVAFRVLPPAIFTMPRLGAFNLHASLLPRYRGAAPINWAIINGETETGVTTFFLQEKVDTGVILLQERAPILPSDDAGSVHDRLAKAGAEIVLRTVRLVESGQARPTAQNDALACPAPRIFREDCRIDWSRPATAIHDRIRGLSPHPAAFTTHAEKVMKVYRSDVLHDATTLAPGTIVSSDQRLDVATGRGVLSLIEVQQEGKKRMGTAEFLRGYHLPAGERLG